MINKKRVWKVETIETAKELARILKEYSTMTCCTGFRLGHLLLLNDAFSEDGAQEYAVINEDRLLSALEPNQMDSLTISWMGEYPLRDALEDLLRRQDCEWESGIVSAHQVQTPAEHGRCPLCA